MTHAPNHDLDAGTKDARLGVIVMGISLAASVLMLSGKLTAYWISGSTAILSDAAESVIHGVATGFAAYSLWFSRQPADRQHLYGHGKIAYVSAGFEGALILGAAGYIIVESVRDLIRGPEVQDLGIGLAITAGLAAINFALGSSLVIVGKRTDALILVANGRHVLADMWTSLGVVVGVAIVLVTDIVWLDPVVAIIVGANIGWTAYGLMRRALRGLLDSVDEKTVKAVVASLDRAVSDDRIKGYHQLRMRHSDDHLFAEVHLLVPGNLTVTEAHARSNAVEDAIRKAVARKKAVHITTHIEPHPHAPAHPHGHSGLHDPFAGNGESV